MVEAAAKLLEKYPTAQLRLVGNSDNSERSEKNTAYSVGRVQNIKRQLIKAGVSPDRITTEVGTAHSRTVELWLK